MSLRSASASLSRDYLRLLESRVDELCLEVEEGLEEQVLLERGMPTYKEKGKKTKRARLTRAKANGATPTRTRALVKAGAAKLATTTPPVTTPPTPAPTPETPTATAPTAPPTVATPTATNAEPIDKRTPEEIIKDDRKAKRDGLADDEEEHHLDDYRHTRNDPLRHGNYHSLGHLTTNRKVNSVVQRNWRKMKTAAADAMDRANKSGDPEAMAAAEAILHKVRKFGVRLKDQKAVDKLDDHLDTLKKSQNKDLGSRAAGLGVSAVNKMSGLIDKVGNTRPVNAVNAITGAGLNAGLDKLSDVLKSKKTSGQSPEPRPNAPIPYPGSVGDGKDSKGKSEKPIAPEQGAEIKPPQGDTAPAQVDPSQSDDPVVKAAQDNYPAKATPVATANSSTPALDANGKGGTVKMKPAQSTPPQAKTSDKATNAAEPEGTDGSFKGDPYNHPDAEKLATGLNKILAGRGIDFKKLSKDDYGKLLKKHIDDTSKAAPQTEPPAEPPAPSAPPKPSALPGMAPPLSAAELAKKSINPTATPVVGQVVPPVAQADTAQTVRTDTDGTVKDPNKNPKPKNTNTGAKKKAAAEAKVKDDAGAKKKAAAGTTAPTKPTPTAVPGVGKGTRSGVAEPSKSGVGQRAQTPAEPTTKDLPKKEAPAKEQAKAPSKTEAPAAAEKPPVLTRAQKKKLAALVDVLNNRSK